MPYVVPLLFIIVCRLERGLGEEIGAVIVLLVGKALKLCDKHLHELWLLRLLGASVDVIVGS